jgi:protein-export membrane protein SecD
MLAVLIALAGVVLGFQHIRIAGLERGSENPLGLSLGLDLQGGSHLVYEAALTDSETGEPVEVTAEQMEAVRRTIERRINASGLGEPILQVIGDDRLLVQLPGVEDPERARELIGQTATLAFKHRRFGVPEDVTNITNDDILAVTVMPYNEVFPEVEPEATETPVAEEGAEPEEETPAEPNIAPVILIRFTPQAAQNFSDIGDELGNIRVQQVGNQIFPIFDRMEVNIEGNETVRFDFPGPSIGTIPDSTDTFAFNYPQPSTAETDPTTQIDLAAAREIIGDAPSVSFTKLFAYVDEDIGLTGESLDRAYPSQHTGTGAPIVNLEFNDEGTRIFAELTTEIAGSADQIAIFLDEQELISPVVTTPITSGTAIIQGQDFTIERVRDVALLLESGRLPIPIELLQERDVDAILGADSLAKSVVAGLVGLGLVLVFMTLYYRVPGLVASLALIIYSVLLLAVFKMLPVTLTLSGVAAAILSIGMAVDANILIFERMKDEIRAGRTLMTSVNIGFNRAWPAIRDSNVSTLITCVILFWFADQLGTTIVQGFAATLAIGVLLSMFTAIVVSRTLLRVMAGTFLSRKFRWFVPTNGAQLPQIQAASSAASRS